MAKTRRKLTKKEKETKMRKKLTLLFKRQDVPIDLILKNLIRKYVKIYYTTLDIEKKIDEIGLMYEYTNKAGETNLTKNPLVSEYKNYCEQLNKTINAMTKYIAVYKDLKTGDQKGGDGKKKNELDGFFERHSESFNKSIQ